MGCSASFPEVHKSFGSRQRELCSVKAEQSHGHLWSRWGLPRPRISPMHNQIQVSRGKVVRVASRQRNSLWAAG